MTHGISEQDWIDYLEDRLAPSDRDRLESHLVGCLTCWELYRQIALTTQMLHEASAEIQLRFPLKDEQLHTRLHEFWACIRAEAENPPTIKPSLVNPAAGLPATVSGRSIADPLRERLALLQSLIARICGARTADNALHAAARSSPARSLAEVTESNWLQFLTRLTSITKTICGETVAYLVWESGQCSGREVVR